MPPWVATLLVGAVTVATNALLLAYYYGRLSARVDQHDEAIDKREKSDERQWMQINDLREDVGRLKGKAGINGRGHI